MERVAPAVTPPFVIQLAVLKSLLAILVGKVLPAESKWLPAGQVPPAELRSHAMQLRAAVWKPLAPLHAERPFMFALQFWTN